MSNTSLSPGVRIPTKFDSWLLLYALIGSLLAIGPDVIYYGNFGVFLLLLFTIPLISVVILVIASFYIRRQTVSALAMLATYGLVSFCLFEASYNLHISGRWLLFSRQYKAEVLAQPKPKNGELKQIEWDFWGMAGQDNSAHLVFDPSDSLNSKRAYTDATVEDADNPPCQVWKIHRLEKQWYSVVFYTNGYWDGCYWK